MLIGGLVPLIGTGVYALYGAESALHEKSFNQLNSLKSIKKDEIENYFLQIQNQVITLSESEVVINMMRKGGESFYTLEQELEVDSKKLSGMKVNVRQFYNNEFATKFSHETNTSISTEELLPTKAAGIIAQHQYISNNQHPNGSKLKLNDVNDGSSYAKAHAEHHPIIRSYLEKFGYYDIFLVDHKTGDIIYSVFKEIDYGTSLYSGVYKETGIAEVVKKAASSNSKDDTFVNDFAWYVPSYNAAASFIASPIFDEGQKIGVLVFQMPVDEINRRLLVKEGLGESGEVYLVGADNLMRSQSRFFEENTILANKIESITANAAISGDEGADITPDYRGVNVLSAYAPLKIKGLNWVILAEIDEKEAFKTVNELKVAILIAMVIAVVFIILIAVLFVRSVMRQLGADPSEVRMLAENIAQGDLTTDLKNIEKKMRVGVYAAMVDMQQKLIEVVQQIQGNSAQISSASSQVSDTANSLSQAASEQAASVEEVSASIEQMGASISQNSENSQTTDKIASESSVAAKEGGESVAQTLQAMTKIAEKITIIEDISYQLICWH